MANDPPYGGRIEVQPGGFVVWQASPRWFKGNKDLTGILKYTIRSVDWNDTQWNPTITSARSSSKTALGPAMTRRSF